jgi:hypothetical protein
MLAVEDLLLNPAKLAEVLEKMPPAPRKSKQQRQGRGDDSEGATEHEVELFGKHAGSLGADARKY